ncbi:coenzyme PQQ precursor peptide PqqA [Paraburkholderia bannensis]|uniref:Coenzyme PQQ synthesis protein A n=1 Tax=Paraburkholderia bannensis TaxID=765414 RepID=A0A7W9U221_9BURK|nr:coenzyme PQQ precursor peptide PqqA [Paraburkholderia sp. WP4_3_2]MBB6104380.1 coenzyme PQQ precursor peptide PqqA [Paraburkholderia bannensis]
MVVRREYCHIRNNVFRAPFHVRFHSLIRFLKALRCVRAVAMRANLIRYARGEWRRIRCRRATGVQFIPPVARTLQQPLFPVSPGVSALPDVRLPIHYSRSFAMWTKPAYTDLRFGFEITMYISNR